MKGFKNIILHQSLQVNYNGNIDGFTFLQQVGDYCRNSVTAAIENYLQKFDDTGEVIQVEKIEMEIDTAGDDWEETVKTEISKKLAAVFDDSSKFAEREIKVQAIPDVYFKALIFYLQKGFLSWNAEVTNLDEYQKRTTGWLQSAGEEDMAKLKASLRNKNAVIRFAALLDEDGFEIFCKKIFRLTNSKSDAKLLEKIHMVFSANSSIAEATVPVSANAAKLLALKCKSCFIQASLFQNTAAATWNHWISQVKNEGPYLYELFRNDILVPEDTDAIYTETGDDTVKEGITTTAGDNENGGLQYEGNLTNEFYVLRDETAYVKNAGAAIIAPFIPALFTNTGLLKNQKITDSSAAVMLLYYCITGNRFAADFELPLLKVLCNLPPDFAVENAFCEDAELLRHADEMLISVTEHWNILGDTSVESLRRSFLQRNGKLYFNNKRWHLFAEHESYDVLLQQLPWNIGLLKLPWMDHALETEWIF